MSSFCSSNFQFPHSQIDIVTYVTSCYRQTPQLTECKYLLLTKTKIVSLNFILSVIVALPGHITFVCMRFIPLAFIGHYNMSMSYSFNVYFN